MNEPVFNPFPNLDTDRMVLRQVSMNDEQDLFKIRSDENTMKYIARPVARTMEEARQLIHIIEESITKGEGITWAITLKDELKLIGTIGFWQIFKEHSRAEIGYILHPDYQGKGIMQEAMEKVLQYGFETMNLHSVQANVDPENTASIKLLERNKFIREAYFKENMFHNGKYIDTAIYTLMNPK